MSERVLSVCLPAAVVSKIDAMAAKLGRPRDRIVEQALVDWVEKEEEHDRLTLQALSDVDGGRVLEHEAVVAWATAVCQSQSG